MRYIVALILALLVVGAAAEQYALPALNAPFTTTTRTLAPCMEDEPCWDCSTMGNHLCGPTKENR